MGRFSIQLDLDPSWDQPARLVLEQAAAFWATVITGALPPVVLPDGQRIENLRVRCAVVSEGSGGDFAQAGPRALRPESAGDAAFLPATGDLFLDGDDVAMLTADGRLRLVLIHELGHVLGFVTGVWRRKKFTAALGQPHASFIGAWARVEYGTLLGTAPADVPIEVRGDHWRESIFGNELMTSLIRTSASPLSRLSIASLRDLGYQVDYAAAAPYSLPPPDKLFESLWLLPAYRMRRTTSYVLPDEALLATVDGE